MGEDNRRKGEKMEDTGRTVGGKVVEEGTHSVKTGQSNGNSRQYDQVNAPSTAAMTTLNIAVSVAVVMLHHRESVVSRRRETKCHTEYKFLFLLTDQPSGPISQTAA